MQFVLATLVVVCLVFLQLAFSSPIDEDDADHYLESRRKVGGGPVCAVEGGECGGNKRCCKEMTDDRGKKCCGFRTRGGVTCCNSQPGYCFEDISKGRGKKCWPCLTKGQRCAEDAPCCSKSCNIGRSANWGECN